MRLRIEAKLEYDLAEATDVLLALEVAQMDAQRLIEDRLVVDGSGPLRPVAGGDGIGRRTWARAEGRFRAAYSATVDVERRIPDLGKLSASPLGELPAFAIPYLWPSRYCESDRFESFVTREFGSIEGGALVAAMSDWIHEHVDYRSGTSDSTTTAADTFVSRQGVCRDFAHLLATFVRAAGIPARLVSAYGWRLDPPDFHALVEVWLAGEWHMVDPSRLVSPDAAVIISVGRDATDIAFMTSFGTAELVDQSVSVERLAD